ncbi:MAG: hypothetical protein V4450_07460 [Bacteroidota bacterium]
MKSKAIKIICEASECTVRVFMRCAFGNDLKGLIISGKPSPEDLAKAWKAIYTEYVDLSGMVQTMEFDLMKSIFYLDCRVKRIQLLLMIQRESIDKLGMPCIGAFPMLKSFGHRLSWDASHPDAEGFKRKLLDIESREKKYDIELGGKMKELFELKRKRANNELPEMQKRKEFIRTLNNLEKSGYRIDRDKSTVEDMAIMIHDYNDAAEKSEYDNDQNRNR